MQAVRDILQAHGYDSVDDMAIGDHIEVDRAEDAMMPLVIEKIGAHRLSVAHYYTHMGDLMSDPEIVFHIDNGVWTPVRYTQHPHVHQHDEDGLPSVKAFAADWSQNLEQQRQGIRRRLEPEPGAAGIRCAGAAGFVARRRHFTD